MNSDDIERRYPDAVVFVMSYLLDKKSSRRADAQDVSDATTVSEAACEGAITAAKILFPDIINGEREAWLRNDVALLIEDYWDKLSAQNSGQRDQTIRGALR